MAPVNWDAFSGIAQAVAAVAAAVAAGAAWRAAVTSERTSRQSSEALALIERPTLQTRGVYAEDVDGRVVGTVYIANPGRWDARDVVVEVRMREGHTFRDQADWLRADAPPLRVQLDEFPRGILGGYEALLIDSITIRFSDHRRTATYERREDYSQLTEPPCVPATSEERISFT